LRLTLRILIVTTLVALLVSSPSLAMRRLGLEAGYVATSQARYGSGLISGLTIMEGVGRFGFGIALQRLANGYTSERLVLDTRTNKWVTYRYPDHISDFFVTIMGTYMRESHDKGALLTACLGPQVHFLTADGEYYIRGSTVTARDSRLGIGAMLRYERVISMFGKTTFVTAAGLSWMQSGIEPIDEYATPAEGMTSAWITVGLAFPI